MDYNTINNLKLDSYQRIISVLSKNVESAAKISKFQNGLDQLDSNQKKLVDLQSQLSKDENNAEKLKGNSRIDLMQKTIPVLTIMQIFAYDKKKKKLSKKVEDVSMEYLQYCSDFQLLNTSREIWKLANKYGGYSLAYMGKIKSSLHVDKLKAIDKLESQYGLMPLMIKNMEEANIRFIESLLNYNEEMKGKDKILKKIKKVHNQTENLLKNKIDRFVSLSESENPDFFHEYHTARTDLLLNGIKENEAENQLPSLEDKPVKETKDKAVGRKTKSGLARRPRPVED